MDQDSYVRLLLGSLITLGSAAIVVATITDRDGYVSAAAAVVCLLSAAAIVYTRRVESDPTEA